MAAAKSIHDNGKGLREAARLHNIPVETLWRHASGSVEPGCKPGPPLSSQTKRRIGWPGT